MRATRISARSNSFLICKSTSVFYLLPHPNISYINETEELCHIHTAQDEIVCTPQHSILTDNGWKQAGEIKITDKVQTTNGFETVVSVDIEHLDEKIKVYNLNVLCYHTYVIGTNQIIVHNQCQIEGKPHAAADHKQKMLDKATEMANSGEYSKIYMNRSLKTTGVAGSNLKPDIIGARNNGGFDIWEIASKSQRSGTGLRMLQAKVDFMNTLQNVTATLIKFI